MLLRSNAQALIWILVLILTSGCNDEQATQVAREAADRQAQQNTAMAELTKEVAGGTRQLVAADAQARTEIVGVHHELQAERTRLDTGWNALEVERRQIAGQRRTESLLVPVLTSIGGVVLLAVLLGFCWYALITVRSADDNDAQLNELLLDEILSEEQTILMSAQRSPSLLGHAPHEDQPTK